jgi:hypothetical protein
MSFIFSFFVYIFLSCSLGHAENVEHFDFNKNYIYGGKTLSAKKSNEKIIDYLKRYAETFKSLKYDGEYSDEISKDIAKILIFHVNFGRFSSQEEKNTILKAIESLKHHLLDRDLFKERLDISRMSLNGIIDRHIEKALDGVEVISKTIAPPPPPLIRGGSSLPKIKSSSSTNPSSSISSQDAMKKTPLTWDMGELVKKAQEKKPKGPLIIPEKKSGEKPLTEFQKKALKISGTK